MNRHLRDQQALCLFIPNFYGASLATQVLHIFEGYEIAESTEWYIKKMARDRAARREYFDVERNRIERNDLFVTQILSEEMKPNDPRLR